MPRLRLWKSKDWMRLQYLRNRLSEEEIAKLAGTTQQTINKWLHIHGLKGGK